MKKNIIILMPAYEPDDKMISLLKELKKNNLQVILVNDGSGSKYEKLFKEASKYSIVISHNINLGKGEALKTGLKYIEENIKKEVVIVTMDCDGQHKVNDALKIAEFARDNLDKLIIGKRLRNKKIPLKSKLGNAITRFVYRLITAVDVYDTQSGLRAFSSNLIPFMLGISGSRFEYEMNVLLECSKNKIKIKEVQIDTIYIEENKQTHFKPIKDSLKIFKSLLKNMFNHNCK